MLRERARFLGRLVIFTDFTLACASYLVSKFILSVRYGIPFGFAPFEAHAAVAANCLILSCLYLQGVYGSMRKKTYRVIAQEVAVAHLQAFALVIFFIFFFKGVWISRQLVTVYFLGSLCLVLLRRAAAKLVLSRVRARGYNMRNILVVGATPLGRSFARSMAEYGYLGYAVVGFLSRDGRDPERPVRGTDPGIVGDFEDLDRILRTSPIDEVVFATTDKEMPWVKLQNALLICEEYGVKMSILPEFFNLRFAEMKLEEVGGLNLVTFLPYNTALLPRLMKQAADTLVSAAALLLFSPFMVGAAIAIKLDSRGPVFFVQKRCGRSGRVFKLLKFRSMFSGAEIKRDGLLKYNEMSGPIFKIKDDPRITRVGRWLRRHSLDELPQLINVLKGDMSLVGPRPPLPEEVEKYERWHRRRLSVKPGITCLWQVSGRNGIDFEDWMRLDLEYIDKWSLRLDFELLFKTIPAVVRGTGM